MSILDRMTRGRGINLRGSYAITERGKEFVSDRFDGSVDGLILVQLEHGSGTVDTISRDMNMPRGRVERVLGRLVRQGYVQDISGSTDEGGVF